MNIALHELGGEIRCTEAGQPSVFDMIRVIGGKKNPHDLWKRLGEQYPDILAKCEFVSFPDSLGRKSRPTPVASDKEAAYYILGLLPGTAGKTYREQAANLFVRYLNADTSLAADIVSRSEDIDGVNKVAEVAVGRGKYLKTYHGVQGELAARGCEGIHHATVNKHNNQLAGVEKGQRKNMDARQELMLTLLQGTEQLKLMDSPKSIQGWDAVNICKATGNALVKLLQQSK